MLAAERRRRILEAIDDTGAVRVAELADELGVSLMTVRRDLDVLDEDDALEKVHGGAIARRNRGEEPSSAAKASREQSEKRAIARAASQRIEDGMTIAMSAGTTTVAVARELRHRQITVVTNSISIFTELTDPTHLDGAPATTVYLTGGTRTRSNALVGPLADTAFASFRVDLSLLGVHGLDVDAGLTTPNLAEAATNRALIAIADSLIVVADHTKLGEVGAHVIAPLSRVDELITDSGVKATVAQQFSSHISRVTTAKPEPH